MNSATQAAETVEHSGVNGKAVALDDAQLTRVVEAVAKKKKKKPVDNSSDASIARMCCHRYAAEWFAGLYGPHLRYNEAFGYVAYGHKWEPDRKEKRFLMVNECADQYIHLAMKSSDIRTVTALLKQAKQCGDYSTQKNILTKAQGLLYEPVSTFDSDASLVNFHGSTLHTKYLPDRFELRPNSAGDYLTKSIPIALDIEAQEPRIFLRHMERVQPDKERRDFVQRLLGYSLLGHNNEHVAPFAFGPTASGKSVTLNAVARAIGPEYAMTASSSLFMQHTNEADRAREFARLYGCRLLVLSETSEGASLNEALVKAVTGGDEVTARDLYHQAFTYRPAFTPWLISNHRPAISDSSGAIWRRLLLVPFEEHIPADERDPKLPEKLECEAPGILCWLVKGLEEYCRIGLQPPASVLLATREYRASEDLIGQFMHECCEPWEYAKVGATDLWQAYLKYSGAKASQTTFGKQLEEWLRAQRVDSLPTVTPKGDSFSGVEKTTIHGRKFYRGLQLKGEQDIQDDLLGR